MKIRYLVGLFVLIGLLVFLFLIPRAEEQGRADSGKLRIVTTFAPLFIFATNVAGDVAQIENLLPSGVGPHDYSFTPSAVAKIANADIVIKQGRGLDDWVDEVIQAAGRDDLTVVVASAGIEAHTGSPVLDITDGYVPASPELPIVRPDSNDPHLWLDPFLAVQEVERIRDGLMSAHPEQRDIYARRAERYILELLALDREIRALLADLPRRDFVSFHPAFRYFAYEYGLREIGVIEEIPGEEPSPQELVRLVEYVRRVGVQVVFSEPQFSPQIVDLLHRDYGLRIAELDPLETGKLHPDYYAEVIRKNVAILVDAFDN